MKNSKTSKAMNTTCETCFYWRKEDAESKMGICVYPRSPNYTIFITGDTTCYRWATEPEYKRCETCNWWRKRDDPYGILDDRVKICGCYSSPYLKEIKSNYDGYKCGHWTDENGDTVPPISELEREDDLKDGLIYDLRITHNKLLNNIGELEHKLRLATEAKQRLESWLVNVYNLGYNVGHQATVVCCYNEVPENEMGTANADTVNRIIAELYWGSI